MVLLRQMASLDTRRPPQRDLPGVKFHTAQPRRQHVSRVGSHRNLHTGVLAVLANETRTSGDEEESGGRQRIKKTSNLSHPAPVASNAAAMGVNFEDVNFAAGEEKERPCNVREASCALLPGVAVVTGPHKDASFLLAGAEMLLGRGHLLSEDGAASEEHAVILLDHLGRAHVMDLLSVKGTRVNGSLVQPLQLIRLAPGDWLECGESTMRWGTETRYNAHPVTSKVPTASGDALRPVWAGDPKRNTDAADAADDVGADMDADVEEEVEAVAHAMRVRRRRLQALRRASASDLHSSHHISPVIEYLETKIQDEPHSPRTAAVARRLRELRDAMRDGDRAVVGGLGRCSERGGWAAATPPSHLAEPSMSDLRKQLAEFRQEMGQWKKQVDSAQEQVRELLAEKSMFQAERLQLQEQVATAEEALEAQAAMFSEGESLQIKELECAVETLTLQVIGQQQDAAYGACTRGNLEIQVRDLQEQLQQVKDQAKADLARAQLASETLEAELCRTKDKLIQLQNQTTHRDAEIRKLAAEWEASLENNNEHREDSGQSPEHSHTSMSNIAERQAAMQGRGGVIRLQYRTAWEEAYLHFSPDNGQWSPKPAWLLPVTDPLLIDHESSSNSKWFEIILPASSLRFVVTDGSSSWDKPPAHLGKEHYCISKPGLYRLHRGFLREIQPVDVDK